MGRKILPGPDAPLVGQGAERHNDENALVEGLELGALGRMQTFVRSMSTELHHVLVMLVKGKALR